MRLRLAGDALQREARSIKGPISVPVSLSNAVKCSPCRYVALNYNRSLHFHGGDTGSTPVRDAKFLRICRIALSTLRSMLLLMDFSGVRGAWILKGETLHSRVLRLLILVHPLREVLFIITLRSE